MFKSIALRIAGGLFALSVLAGGTAMIPADSAAAAYSKTLYTVYFNDGSGQGQALRAQCEASAPYYGAISATAHVTGKVRYVNGVWQNRLDCVGTFWGFPHLDLFDLPEYAIAP